MRRGQEITRQEILDRDRVSSAGEGPILLTKLVTMVKDLGERNGVGVEAVGLGVAGLAHRSGVIHYSPNLPDLVEYPLGTELSAELGGSRDGTANVLQARWQLDF